MKNRFLMLIASLMIIITSCNDSNLTDIGSNIQPPGDKILVAADTFSIISENYPIEFMYSRPDSFLLGTFYDQKYGTVHADIFAQVEHPKNHVYQPNTTPDSILLVMQYQKYFGDKHSPMHVSVYEMNKDTTFRYLTPYATNLNPDVYVDKSVASALIGEKTFTAVDASGEQDSTYVTIKLSNEFMQRFTNVSPDIYTDESKFLKFFNGLFITTDFGSASMLYVRQIDMIYYHSYTYTTKDVSGQDSLVKVNVSVTFPANSRVRQVNRFLHPDKNNIINQLENQTDQVHHISSPANIYTRVSLPIKRMQQRMEGNGLRLAINNAKLRIDINNLNEENYAQPIPSSILLIRESSLERFFTKREFPSDTCAILGTYAYEKNSETGEYNYYYTFDISGLIAHEFKQAKTNEKTPPEKTNFLLVPVRLKTSNNTVTDVSQQFLLNAVTICGGNHPQKPIKAHVVYSGF